MKSEYTIIPLRDRPELMDWAAAWFHEKWRVPTEAYLECMTAYLNRETEYGWYLCLSGERIVGGLGVIENDFHNSIRAARPGSALTDRWGRSARCHR